MVTSANLSIPKEKRQNSESKEEENFETKEKEENFETKEKEEHIESKEEERKPISKKKEKRSLDEIVVRCFLNGVNEKYSEKVLETVPSLAKIAVCAIIRTMCPADIVDFVVNPKITLDQQNSIHMLLLEARGRKLFEYELLYALQDMAGTLEDPTGRHLQRSPRSKTDITPYAWLYRS